MTKRSPFRYFKTSPGVIRVAVMLFIRFPLSLRKFEDLLQEHGIEIRKRQIVASVTFRFLFGNLLAKVQHSTTLVRKLNFFQVDVW